MMIQCGDLMNHLTRTLVCDLIKKSFFTGPEPYHNERYSQEMHDTVWKRTIACELSLQEVDRLVSIAQRFNISPVLVLKIKNAVF